MIDDIAVWLQQHNEPRRSLFIPTANSTNSVKAPWMLRGKMLHWPCYTDDATVTSYGLLASAEDEKFDANRNYLDVATKKHFHIRSFKLFSTKGNKEAVL